MSFESFQHAPHPQPASDEMRKAIKAIAGVLRDYNYRAGDKIESAHWSEAVSAGVRANQEWALDTIINDDALVSVVLNVADLMADPYLHWREKISANAAIMMNALAESAKHWETQIQEELQNGC